MKRKKAHRPSGKLHGKVREACEIWEDRLEEISIGWARRPVSGGDPDNRRSAFLLREIYRLVNELREVYGDRLEHALLAKMDRTPEIPFHKAPYLWALKAANGAEDITMTPDMVLRYGLALNYANSHNVPPHFICGFLHQVGGIRSIDQKLQAGQMEYWLNSVKLEPDEEG